MAGTKKINIVNGTGNPVRVQDLNALWEAVNALSIGKFGNQPAIVSGFNTTDVVAGTPISSGVIYFNGQAYYMNDGIATIGQYLYAQQVPEEQRTYEDGVSRYFYTNMVVNAAGTNNASGLGTLIGQATVANIGLWRSTFIGDGAVGTNQLANNSVTSAKIPSSAVGATQIASGAVLSSKIATQAVITEKLADKSVTPEKLSDDALPGSKIENDAISTDKVKDGAITPEKQQIKIIAATFNVRWNSAGGFLSVSSIETNTGLPLDIYAQVQEPYGANTILIGVSAPNNTNVVGGMNVLELSGYQEVPTYVDKIYAGNSGSAHVKLKLPLPANNTLIRLTMTAILIAS